MYLIRSLRISWFKKFEPTVLHKYVNYNKVSQNVLMVSTACADFSGKNAGFTKSEKNTPLLSVIAKTFPRDIRGLKLFGKTLWGIKRAEKYYPTVASAFDETVKKYPENVCFYYEDQSWTFKEVQKLSFQIANYFGQMGYQKGDKVALFMENCPDYMCLWLGLSRLGVVVPLINSNLKSKPLAHSFNTAKCKGIIFGHSLDTAMQSVLKLSPYEGKLYSWGSSEIACAIDLQRVIQKMPDELSVDVPKISFNDTLMYVYTSGTTGLPKPAIVKHSRYAIASIFYKTINNMSNKDVLYTSLPIYHTAGGICGIGQVIYAGTAVAIRRKFSAKEFWTDCIKYNATSAQYIGEICRYLLQQQPSEVDKQHKVKRIIGNGLRAEIWKEFLERFNISDVTEIYGATDGNCNMANFDNKIGAVGFLPRLAYKLYPIAIVKTNEQTGDIVRDPKTGLAVRCAFNEPGELVGRIEKDHPARDFGGYATGNKSDNNKKIVRDIFAKGDSAFRTGDIMLMDEYGYFYFKDRTGDTYRWKGENVSTAEVEAIISAHLCQLSDVVAYGVKIPHTEGSAGMVSIVDPKTQLNVQEFGSEIKKLLPSYAIPLFLRVLSKVELTGTFKLKKVDLQKQGFNITEIQDPIYFYHNGKYSRLDENLYRKIMSGSLSL